MDLEDVLMIAGMISIFIIWYRYGFDELLRMILSTLAVSTVFYYIFTKVRKRAKKI